MPRHSFGHLWYSFAFNCRAVVRGPAVGSLNSESMTTSFSNDATGNGLDLLERRLVDPHTTVIIPLDDRVIFVSLLNCAEFSSRLSEVPQTLDPISGSQFLARSRGPDRCGCNCGCTLPNMANFSSTWSELSVRARLV